jgi:hypothetical protein
MFWRPLLALSFVWYGWTSYMPNVASFFRVPPPVTSGWAVYYIPGQMEATAQYRGFPLNPQPPFIGYVATMSPAMIGWSVWLKREGYAWEGPYLSVDCPRRNDQYGLIVYKHESVEVDFNTAVRWGFVQVTGWDDNQHYAYKVIVGGEADVQVSYYRPSDNNPPAVVYKDWYQSVFASGPKNEYVVEDIPTHPERWCITAKQTCENAWRTFEQPKLSDVNGMR